MLLRQLAYDRLKTIGGTRRLTLAGDEGSWRSTWRSDDVTIVIETQYYSVVSGDPYIIAFAHHLGHLAAIMLSNDERGVRIHPVPAWLSAASAASISVPASPTHVRTRLASARWDHQDRARQG